MAERIYTKTGDTGETGLFGGLRVKKSAERVNAYGEVDELNAFIGWTIVQNADATIIERLGVIQADLFALGAHLATAPREDRKTPALPPLPVERIAEMESWIDDAEDELPALRSFILPGGAPGGAALHVARTVCRRAERAVVRLQQTEFVDAAIITYLNRLSDLLFDLARLANYRADVPETKWHPD